MKSAIITLFAIGGFIASTIANPLGYTTTTTSLSKHATMETVPQNATSAEIDSDVSKIIPQLQTITDLLTAANSTVTVVVKRAFLEKRHGKDDLFKTLSIIIYELLGTVKFIIIKLGLGKVLIYLAPLVLALKSLLLSLDLVVGGVLIAVGAIVNELLAAVGIGLIGII
ncbi:hypothetical protein GGS20DRAFT_583371 [Poronia punctata]|nr:hypothetical protein GGS20DRAFT_583371 [Poronia punctata]